MKNNTVEITPATSKLVRFLCKLPALEAVIEFNAMFAKKGLKITVHQIYGFENGRTKLNKIIKQWQSYLNMKSMRLEPEILEQAKIDFSCQNTEFSL